MAANRGRPWQSVYFLQRIRNRMLSLASERRGLDSQDFVHIDELPQDETFPLEATLVPNLERDVLLDAIELATRAFLEELARHDQALADRLAEPLVDLISASKADKE